jgi:transglutaminase-like putative cysteine protease
MRRRSALLAAAAIALGSAPAARAAPPFLGGLELDAPATLGAPPWSITFVLRGVRPEMLGELRSRYGEVGFDGARATAALRGYPTLPDGPVAADRSSGFFVDPEEPAIQALRAQIEAAHGARPRASELTAFVAAFITEKDLSRRFDPASVVAERRQGDCSEHAVLLAALCRLYGLPAHVVAGFVVLMPADGRPLAAGHAWVEVYEDARWQLADATEPWALRPVHLPIWTLRDDGPGASLLDGTRLSFLHVTGLAVRPAPGVPAAKRSGR